MKRMLRGAVAGGMATVVMTIWMFAGRAAGLLHEPSPSEITRQAQNKSGLTEPQASRSTFTASWLATHLAFGAGGGALYGLLRPLIPGSGTAAGTAYGFALWAVNYLGIMPALGLYPFPTDDSRSRAAVIFTAHGVYGATLGALVGDE